MIEYTVKVYPDGDKYWYLNDELHREDGPAIELATGEEFWYLNGELLSREEWEKRLKKPCSGKIVEIEGVKYKLEEV